jgi:hypothetical protein
MISPEDAIKIAERGLDLFGLRKNTKFASNLMGAQPGAALFIRRLDQRDRGYYLVPWISKDGIVLVIEVDGLKGTVAGFSTLPQAQPSLVIKPEEAIAIVSSDLGRKAIGEPQLVWRPCRESSSPLRPFYEVKTGEGEVYVGMDGHVYINLTPFGKGG